MTILEKIFAHKRQEVAARQQVIPLAAMRQQAETAVPPQAVSQDQYNPFLTALR